jgi:hypothetical protein
MLPETTIDPGVAALHTKSPAAQRRRGQSTYLK